MVEVLKKPRWSIWRYHEVYKCDLPPHCRDPLGLAASFFKGRGIHDLRTGRREVRFLRGSTWGSLFSFFERHQKQEVCIRIDDSQRCLICEYRVFNPYPDLHIPPWLLQREVQQLEVWIAKPANLVPSPSTAEPEDAGAAKADLRHLGLVRWSPFNILFRLLYRFHRIISWMRHWETRRVTRAGHVLLIGGCVAAMLGFDPENSVGYQGFALLFALLLVSVVFGGGFRVSFAAERLLPRFGTAGQPFTYRVRVLNRTRKHQHGLTLLENLAEVRPTFSEWKAVQLDEMKYVRPFRFSRRRWDSPFRVAKVNEALVPPLPAQQSGEVQVKLTPLRRGVVRFDGLTLARPDPLGLFRALRRIALPSSVLILPKRYPLPPVALPGALKYQRGGVAMASNVGQSEEFVALRDYRRGDPLRHIHWRSWAKAGKPIVKEFEDEFFVRHALILDTFTRRPHSDEFEEAVSVAASFACTVLTQESLLDLLFVERQAYCFTAGRGLAHADQMLEILASVRPCNGSFTTLEYLVLSHTSMVSGCIVVLLVWDEPRRRLVEKLKVLGLPVLVLVIRSPGKSEPLDPGPLRDEPERLVALEVGKIEEQLARLR